MNKLLVAYDLNREIVRPKILEEIKRTAWAMLSESSYAIQTWETPEQVFRRLERYLDGNDRLFVVELTGGYYGQGPAEVHNWMRAATAIAA